MFVESNLKQLGQHAIIKDRRTSNAIFMET